MEARPVVLVVADASDVGVRAAVSRRPGTGSGVGTSSGSGPSPLVVSPRDLARAIWVHRVDDRGRSSTALTLPGRPTLHEEDLAAVWYRAGAPLVPPAAAAADPRDHLYAVAELTALVTSWLLALGPRAVNPPSGADPTGPAWPPDLWASLGRRAGLGTTGAGPPTTGRVDGADGLRQVLVLGGRVVGAADEDETGAALALAGRAGCRSLGLVLDARGRLVAATTCPVIARPEEVRAARAFLQEMAA